MVRYHQDRLDKACLRSLKCGSLAECDHRLGSKSIVVLSVDEMLWGGDGTMDFMSKKLRQNSAVFRSPLILLMWAVSAWTLSIAPADSAGRPTHSNRMAVSAVEEDTAVASPSGGILLASQTDREGNLRERLRERREARSLARNREKDAVSPQGPNEPQFGRRITRERVQAWIEQLRERIQAEIGASAGTRDVEVQQVPNAGADLPPPNIVVPPGSTRPLYPLIPANPKVSAGVQDFPDGQPQESGVHGPELVAPESASAVPSPMQNAEAPPAVPRTATEKPLEDERKRENAGQETDSHGGSSEPSVSAASKSTGLGGLFSNVTKMFGTPSSPKTEQPSKGESQQSQTGPGQTTNRQEASESSKPQPTTRKTLAEIRKQILSKQNQDSAGPRQ